MGGQEEGEGNNMYPYKKETGGYLTHKEENSMKTEQREFKYAGYEDRCDAATAAE
jgi:hypothetical protein